MDIANRQDLEDNIKYISSVVKNPNYGIFGPHTKVWEINREACTFFGSGYAVLLQTAWPAVATSVKDHSKFKDDYVGRAMRTFENVFQITLSDLDTAFKAARRVHNIHSKISGNLHEHDNSKYAANDKQSLLWVASTLWDTSIKMYETFVRTLSDEEKEQYYQESKLFAYLFAIKDDTLPKNWEAFQTYYNGILHSNKLNVTESGKYICDRLFIPNHLMTIPGYAAKILTANFLPEHLINAYGLPWSKKDQIASKYFVNFMKFGYSKIPLEVRTLPQYKKALQRIEKA